LVKGDESVKKNVLEKFLRVEKKSNKGKLSKKYLQECLTEGMSLGVDLDNSKNNKDIVCEDCNIERIINHKLAIAVCPECGDTIEY
jgi:hypothetical protein